MPLARLEPAIPAIKQLQTLVLYRKAIRISTNHWLYLITTIIRKTDQVE